jgi:hypothetical protein
MENPAMKLTQEERTLLHQVVQARCPEHGAAVERLGNLNSDEKLALQQAIADELIASGLGDDDEPNENGLRLEALIDAIGRS